MSQKITTYLWFDKEAEEAMKFYALDGGPIFKFNEAVSRFVDCSDQAEVLIKKQIDKY